MKKIFCILMALVFLSGCALSTIKPPKKAARRAEPVKKTVVEKVKEAFKPAEEKEEILPSEEEIK